MAASGRRCAEPFECPGVWWLPQQSELTIVGPLSWSATEGASVDLMGFFSDGSDPTRWQGPIVHGVAEGDEYTLLGCRTAGFNLQSPGLMRQKIRAFGGCLVGMHLPDAAEAGFDRLVIELDYLTELSQRSGMRTEVAWDDGDTIGSVALIYEHARPTRAVLRDETITLGTAWKTGGSLVGHAEMSETVQLVVETREPLPLRQLLDRYLSRFRDLVTLAAQGPAAVRYVGVSGPVTARTLPGGRAITETLSFLGSFLPYPQSGDPPRLRQSLFQFPQGERAFRELMLGWSNVADALGPVLDLRFGSSYAGFVYGETRFLNTAQSVEALHRRLLEQSPAERDVEARSAALATCPTEYRAWLDEKLRYAHEPSFRTRLRETLDYVGPGLNTLVPRRAQFVQRVVKARNDLTHWDTKKESHAGTDLYGLATILAYAIDGALLRCLGYSEAEVAETLHANEHFQWVVSAFAS